MFIACFATSARAEDDPYQPPDFLSVTPPLPPSLAGPTVWRLQLAEAIQIAVRHNLDIILERHSVEVSRLGTDVARGSFEPTVSAGYRHSNVLSPPATSQEGTADEIFNAIDDAWRIGINQRLTSGTQLTLDIDNGS